MTAIAATTKTEALKKSKRAKMIFIFVIVFIALAIATYTIIYFVKKRKEKKILEGTETKTQNNNSSGSSQETSLPRSINLNSKENVSAIQNAINRDNPEAKLSVDGEIGPLTIAAIKKYYGNDAYPLTSDSLAKIIGGSPSAIGFPKPSSQANDNFPLIKGSKGPLVTSLKKAVKAIQSKYPVTLANDVFDEELYTAINAGIGTKYYPVTFDNYQAIGNMYNKTA